ncbi:hypothetical protein KSP39_PZI002903 [Platanthera zijinensis]|uniref:CCHC-type domain-containing protein n=1 Tax=Platanthera zijinensis TaxID=2320716 RepID=A0AAP0BZ66_9ASPA
MCHARALGGDTRLLASNAFFQKFTFQSISLKKQHYNRERYWKMSKVEDVIDDHFLSLIEEAEADAIAAGGVIKRPKLSDAISGGGGRQENQEEGSYMAALRGSRSSLWQRQQNDLNLLKKDSGGSGLGSRSSATTPSSTMAAGACFKCGMSGHWARDCGGAQAGSADHTDGLAPAMPCPCGAGTCLVLTSNTAKNPGRMFYRCPLKARQWLLLFPSRGKFPRLGNSGPPLIPAVASATAASINSVWRGGGRIGGVPLEKRRAKQSLTPSPSVAGSPATARPGFVGVAAK